jgi:hypothetical protein
MCFLSVTTFNFNIKSLKEKLKLSGEKIFLAGPRGIEPLTYGLRAST